MSTTDDIMALADEATDAECEYRVALRIDVAVSDAGRASYEADEALRAAVTALVAERDAALKLADQRLWQMQQDRKQALEWRDDRDALRVQRNECERQYQEQDNEMRALRVERDALKADADKTVEDVLRLRADELAARSKI